MITAAVLLLLAFMFRHTFAAMAMEWAVYHYGKAESTWHIWERWGYDFVRVTTSEGETYVSHLVRSVKLGPVIQYRDNYGYMRLSADGTTNDANFTWEPLTAGSREFATN